MNYAANPLASRPCCEDCEQPCFIEQMSEVSPALCLDCAERADDEARAKVAAEVVAEFRYASRYWLAVRPINQASLSDLVDAKDVESALVESAARARYLLGERFFDAPVTSSDRDNREIGSR